MATSKYELPDETLQLIAASNFANAFSPFNQNVTPSQSAGALKPDNLARLSAQKQSSQSCGGFRRSLQQA